MKTSWLLETCRFCVAILALTASAPFQVEAAAYQLTLTAQPDPENPESYVPARVDFAAQVRDDAGNVVDPNTLDIHWTFGDLFPNTQRSKGHDYDVLNPVYLYVDPGEVTVKVFVRKKDDHSKTGGAALKVVVRRPQTGLREFYAAPDGSDDNPGTRDKPWRNLHTSIASLKPGDTLFLRGGTYDISKTAPERGIKGLSFGTNGTPAQPITVQGFPGEEAIITSQYTSAGCYINRDFVHVRDLVIEKSRAGIVFGRGKGLVFDGLTIRHILGGGNENTSAFYPHSMTESVIRNGLYHDVWMRSRAHVNSAGVMLYWCRYNVIENNEVYHTGQGFFDKDGNTGTIIRYNYIHDVTCGVTRSTQGEHEALNGRIHNNVFVSVAGAIRYWGNMGEIRGDRVFNNTIYACGSPFTNLNRKGYHWDDQRLWNNLCVDTTGTYTWGGAFVYCDYGVIGGTINAMGFSDNRMKHDTLEAWRAATGLDAHSVQLESVRFRVSDPKRPEDFRLPPDSPLRKAPMLGRFGNEMRGAYPFDDVVIGRPLRTAQK